MNEEIAAPTAEEVLERLPETIKKSKSTYCIYFKKQDTHWYVKYWEYRTHRQAEEATDGKSLAEAAGKMWLYLKTNNLI